MSTNQRRNVVKGFTLIEVIIAIALASAMVVTVYAATRSMTGVARRQSEAGQTEARTARALEILKKDLRGWIPEKPDRRRGRRGQQKDEKAFELVFRTSADAMLPRDAPDGLFRQGPATTMLRYSLGKDSNGYALFRAEGSQRAFTVDLFRSKEPITVEFFDGKEWANEWRKEGRPEGFRITLDSTRHCIRL